MSKVCEIKILRIMNKFYKIKLLLLCISVIIANCAVVLGEKSQTQVKKETILPLSQIASINDGRVERTKRGLLDFLLSDFQEYFDYSEEDDDTSEDQKYLICRNCTIVVSQTGNQPASQPATKPNDPLLPPMDEVNKVNKGANGEDKPPTDDTQAAAKPPSDAVAAEEE